MCISYLGPIEDWLDILKGSASAGYNMVHFTPVQQLGESQSPYSIADQLKLSSKIFGDRSEKDAYEDLGRLTSLLQDKGVLSMIDMVWNHTAVCFVSMTDDDDDALICVSSSCRITACG